MTRNSRAHSSGGSGLLARPRRYAAEALDRHFFIWLFLVLLVATGLKTWPFLAAGRLWAEEGSVFLAETCALPPARTLAFLFNNHLNLWQNGGIALAGMVSLAQAAKVTTLYGLAVQWAVLLVIAARRRDLGLPDWAVLVVVICAIGIPQSDEVWATTTSLHFFGALLACVLLAAPPRGARDAGLVALAGLSGIPANFTAPLFLVAAAIERSRARLLQGLILCATSAVQIGLLLASGYDNSRGLSFQPDLVAFAMLTQNVWALFFGGLGGSFAGGLFRDALAGPGAGGAGLAVLLVAVSLVLLWRAFPFGPVPRAPNAARWTATKLLVAALVTAALSVTLSLEQDIRLVSAAGGARYFYASSILVAIAFLSLAQWTPLRLSLLLLLVVSALAGLPAQVYGPPYREALDAAAAAAAGPNAPLLLDIWPAGWRAELPGACRS